MKKLILLLLLPILVKAQYFAAPEYKVPLLFDEPRKGYWTMRPMKWEVLDDDCILHFATAGLLQIEAENLFRNKRHGSFYASALVFGLGLLKEIEDGNREGFGRLNLLSDILGQIIGHFIFKLF